MGVVAVRVGSLGHPWLLGILFLIVQLAFGVVSDGISLAQTASPPDKVNPNELEAFFRDGFRIESRNKLFRMRVGGRIYADFGYIAADDELKDAFADFKGHGAIFRQARINVEGGIFDNFIFQSEIDFTANNRGAGNGITIRNLWLGRENIPYVGAVRVGNMKEPFSLEELTADYFVTFMERGLPNAFNAVYNTGIRFNNAFLDQRISYGLGAFLDTNDVNGQSFRNTSDVNLTGRITGLPWYEGGGERLLHLGVSSTHQFRDDNVRDNPLRVRYSSRAETFLSDARLVDTRQGANDILSTGVDVIGGEAAVVMGPWHLSGEYTQSFVGADGEVNRRNGYNLLKDDPSFFGYYAQLGCLVTGETRPYVNATGSFGRIRPRRNFELSGDGWGAFEVAARLSQLNLDRDSYGINGGKETDVTVGVNWYLNPQMRVQLNWVHAMLDSTNRRVGTGAAARTIDLDGTTADVIQTRFAIDF